MALGMIAGVVGFGATHFALAGILVMLFVAIWLLDLLRAHPTGSTPPIEIRVPPGGWIGLAFLAFAVVRVPSSSAAYEARLECLEIFGLLAAYWAASRVAGSGRRWAVIWGGLLLSVSLICSYAIIQNWRGSMLVWGLMRPEQFGMRASGTYFCPNHFANLVSISACLSVALLLTPEVGSALRLVGIANLIIGGYPLILSQSRSAFLGTAVGVTATTLLCCRPRGARPRVVVLTGAVLLLAFGMALWTLSPENRARIADAGEGRDPRVLLWKNTLDLIVDRPFLGHGAGSFRDEYARYQDYRSRNFLPYAHNELLNTASEYGLVGLVLLGASFVAAGQGFAVALRACRDPVAIALSAGFAGAMGTSMIHSLFDFNFHIFGNSLVLSIVAGTAAAMLFQGGHLRAWRPRARGRVIFWITGLSVALLAAGTAVPSVVSAIFSLRADQQQSRSNLPEAERLYRAALQADPESWAPYLSLASLVRVRAGSTVDPRERRKLEEEAIALYARCSELAPRKIEPRLILASMLSSLGEHDRALTQFQWVADFAPQQAFYRVELGKQLRRMGMNEEAAGAFRRAVELDPGNTAATAQLSTLQWQGAH